MSIKVYTKKGARNFKEKALEKKLIEFFTNNPDKVNDFQPATDFDELKSLHDHYCIEAAEVVSETINEPAEPTSHESFRDSIEVEKEPEPIPQVTNPLNRDEPIIRDYVKDDGFTNDSGQQKTNSTYSEPTNFRESFEIPNPNGDVNNKDQPLNSQPSAKKTVTPDPDNKLKKKSKKAFTKYVVEAACNLAAAGVVWYGTKDITEDKLAEYVRDGVINKEDLELMVWIDSVTRGSVKQFFRSRTESLIQLASFTADEKEELVEALDLFLEYKKIDINPTINLIGIGLGMLASRAMKGIEIKMETKSVLDQLIEMKAGQQQQRVHYTPPPTPEQAQSEAGTEKEQEPTEQQVA